MRSMSQPPSAQLEDVAAGSPIGHVQRVGSVYREGCGPVLGRRRLVGFGGEVDLLRPRLSGDPPDLVEPVVVGGVVVHVLGVRARAVVDREGAGRLRGTLGGDVPANDGRIPGKVQLVQVPVITAVVDDLHGVVVGRVVAHRVALGRWCAGNAGQVVEAGFADVIQPVEAADVAVGCAAVDGEVHSRGVDESRGIAGGDGFRPGEVGAGVDGIVAVPPQVGDVVVVRAVDHVMNIGDGYVVPDRVAFVRDFPCPGGPAEV